MKEKNLLSCQYLGDHVLVENVYREVLEESGDVLGKLGWGYRIVDKGPVFT